MITMDIYPGEAENWLFMKLSARSCDTGWIQSVTCMKAERYSLKTRIFMLQPYDVNLNVIQTN